MPRARAGASDCPARAAVFRSNAEIVFRHFPLIEIHPNAEGAAEAAEFAGVSGLFWDMHDRLYENQDRLGPDLVFAVADYWGCHLRSCAPP